MGIALYAVTARDVPGLESCGYRASCQLLSDALMETYHKFFRRNPLP